MFCWCPLYLLDCDGDFVVNNGIKDCSNCSIPHTEEGYDYVLEVANTMVYRKNTKGVIHEIAEISVKGIL